MIVRDDFGKVALNRLASRAGHRCSNPDCHRPTSGPESTTDGSVNIGVGAHITAASAGGPRFDPYLTPAERSAVANGIWLCQFCAKLIDSDTARFTQADWMERRQRIPTDDCRLLGDVLPRSLKIEEHDPSTAMFSAIVRGEDQSRAMRPVLLQLEVLRARTDPNEVAVRPTRRRGSRFGDESCRQHHVEDRDLSHAHDERAVRANSPRPRRGRLVELRPSCKGQWKRVKALFSQERDSSDPTGDHRNPGWSVRITLLAQLRGGRRVIRRPLGVIALW
jgi:hypothetical protein